MSYEDKLNNETVEDIKPKVVKEAVTGHPDVEYEVDDPDKSSKVFKTWDEAAGHILSMAASGHEGKYNINILVYSEAGAKAVGLEDDYAEDPESSVTQRIEFKITSNVVGRVP
jgi:hypothetical protein